MVAQRRWRVASGRDERVQRSTRAGEHKADYEKGAEVLWTGSPIQMLCPPVLLDRLIPMKRQTGFWAKDTQGPYYLP